MGNEASYTEKHYHQPSEAFDPRWIFAGMGRDLELMYGLGSDPANSRRWPTGLRIRRSARRDKSAAQRKQAG